MGAQSSAGRGLVNLRPRERIGQSYPAGRDAHKIHPCRVEQIVSVKINPSLVMMRECTLYNDQDTDCVIRVTAATPQRQSNPTPSHSFRARHKVAIAIYDIVTTSELGKLTCHDHP